MFISCIFLIWHGCALIVIIYLWTVCTKQWHKAISRNANDDASGRERKKEIKQTSLVFDWTINKNTKLLSTIKRPLLQNCRYIVSSPIIGRQPILLLLLLCVYRVISSILYYTNISSQNYIYIQINFDDWQMNSFPSKEKLLLLCFLLQRN